MNNYSENIYIESKIQHIYLYKRFITKKSDNFYINFRLCKLQNLESKNIFLIIFMIFVKILARLK